LVIFSLPTNGSQHKHKVANIKWLLYSKSATAVGVYSKSVVYLTDSVAISVAVPGKVPTNIPTQFICEEMASLFFIAHIIEAFWEH
jgi:hypothetical protein